MHPHRTLLHAPNYARRNVIHFAGGFAWPARDQRNGHFVVRRDHEALFRLAVHDDMGELREVPSLDLTGATALPLSYFPQGAH